MAGIRERVALNIRKIRKGNGLSQEQLADLCGLHRTYIGSVERSERGQEVGTRVTAALRLLLAELQKEGRIPSGDAINSEHLPSDYLRGKIWFKPDTKSRDKSAVVDRGRDDLNLQAGHEWEQAGLKLHPVAFFAQVNNRSR